MKTEQQRQFYSLLSALREDVITDEQFSELDHILSADRQAAREYIRFIKLWTDLQFFQLASQEAAVQPLSSLEMQDSDVLTDSRIWQVLAESEKTAPTVQVDPQQGQAVELIRKVVHEKGRYKIKKSSLISIITSIAAILMIILFGRFAPPKSGVSVATLADSINAKWGDSGVPMKEGTRLVTGATHSLLGGGLVKLIFDNNAMVTIEGPAEFEIISEDRVKLQYGRLYSIVPQEALGFSVATPNAMVIDLGTQFGVQVDFQGNTELHVTQGKTTVVAGKNKNKASLEVNEGSARKITGVSSSLSEIPCNDAFFVRQINSRTNVIWRGQPIDLSDMFCGGNGLGTGNPQESINPVTGSIVACVDEDREGSGQYVSVPGRRFIDGVFVPNSAKGPVRISSQGHVFAECPPTNNVYYFDLHNGLSHDRLNFDGIAGTAAHFNEMERQPNIMLHANLGITFDLEAIRAEYPMAEISRFTTWVGIADNQVRQGNADVWVLVDGQLRFSLKQLRETGKPCPVRVDLNPSDRFLTLAVTDGGDKDELVDTGRATDSDWCLFVAPQLETSK